MFETRALARFSLYVNCPLLFRFQKTGTDRKILVKIPSMRFNEDRVIGCTLDPCLQTNATILIGI